MQGQCCQLQVRDLVLVSRTRAAASFCQRKAGYIFMWYIDLLKAKGKRFGIKGRIRLCQCMVGPTYRNLVLVKQSRLSSLVTWKVDSILELIVSNPARANSCFDHIIGQAVTYFPAFVSIIFSLFCSPDFSILLSSFCEVRHHLLLFPASELV